ncbi:MAG: enoyl-CoA hydratase/isomerase family protein [Alphaproteobacteria bacterium]|nr:enoyl-CoA hydratase/isomerase family protein [Alphaproteobacteria bacterium]
MGDTIKLSIAKGRADITLNRPEIHNAFDQALISHLAQILDELESNTQVRVIVLSGAGKSFSAGGDLNWMRRTASQSFDENLADAKALAALLNRLDTLSKPTIARIHGQALGGGVGLVSCCDIAVAAPEASFSLSEVKLGLIPATISPYVTAAMGARAARRYFLTGERFSAAEALRLGLVHDVVPLADLDQAVDRLVASLLANGPEAIAHTKDLIRLVAKAPIDDALKDETAGRIAKRRASLEGKEGVTAFLEKRKPSWQEGS